MGEEASVGVHVDAIPILGKVAKAVGRPLLRVGELTPPLFLRGRVVGGGVLPVRPSPSELFEVSLNSPRGEVVPSVILVVVDFACEIRRFLS